MKKLCGMVLATAAGLLLVGFTAAGEKATPASNACFDALKKLAGDWVAADKDGKPTNQIMSSIRVTSGGNTVQEVLFPGTDHEMVTMYHLDGKDLVLTHYCILGNQPRLKAEAGSNPSKLIFKFAGGTNLNPEKDSHMHEAVLEILDDQHIKTEWTKCDEGKPCDKHGFSLVRKQK
jgi:hypothetical protein